MIFANLFEFSSWFLCVCIDLIDTVLRGSQTDGLGDACARLGAVSVSLCFFMLLMKMCQDDKEMTQS